MKCKNNMIKVEKKIEKQNENNAKEYNPLFFYKTIVILL